MVRKRLVLEVRWKVRGEASFLNRVVRWDPTSGTAELEADMTRVAMVLRDLELEQSMPVATRVAHGSHVEITLDQAWQRGAQHHSTEQWRVWALRVAQVVSSCARNRSNAERLASRCEMRDSHVLRQQRGKRHVCSARIVENSRC